MDRVAVARELVALAKSLMAIEFPTQDAMDKYLKDHPDADRSNHKVVETKQKPSVKKDKPDDSQVENAVRDNLSGTERVTTEDKLFGVVKLSHPKMDRKLFKRVWDSLVDDGYLKKSGDGYKWEM